MKNLLLKTEQALFACLQEIPFLKIKEVKRNKKGNQWMPDFIVNCQEGQNQKIFVVAFKDNGQPRVAKQTINELLLYLKDFPKRYAIFAAPYISPRAAEICIENGINYIDLAGNCLLSFEKVFIKREGRSNPLIKRRDLRSLYSPKAERMLRALLTMPKKTWKMNELADEVRISLGQIFNVKKLLADREWIKVEGKSWYLQNPEELLKEWTESYNFRRNQLYNFYSMQSISEIENDLSIACQKEKIPFALTGFSGGARFLPTVRYQRVMAYIEEKSIERIAKRLNLKEVNTGPNITLLAPYDEGVFYRKKNINQTEVVSFIQLYLDLMNFGGRGEEAAQALLEEVIKPQW